jgi:alkylhydroperoxidase family enzyme
MEGQAMTQRIPGADPEQVTDAYVARVFEAQTKKWGAPLYTARMHGRLPALLRGVQGMWGAIDASGLIDERLKALVNRRVATINGCPF